MKRNFTFGISYLSHFDFSFSDKSCHLQEYFEINVSEPIDQKFDLAKLGSFWSIFYDSNVLGFMRCNIYFYISNHHAYRFLKPAASWLLVCEMNKPMLSVGFIAKLSVNYRPLLGNQAAEWLISWRIHNIFTWNQIAVCSRGIRSVTLNRGLQSVDCPLSIPWFQQPGCMTLLMIAQQTTAAPCLQIVPQLPHIKKSLKTQTRNAIILKYSWQRRWNQTFEWRAVLLQWECCLAA